ncbi:hypothetical protein KSU1_C1566 [Candidatus Jettenia caeni]|uniref:Uncharacterized protein n=1 Tax=Candidatus Jettenia caeni TaxID=247490 RepID=I3IN67_9BACT|nr:hypothetical protein KSU1_C1566 [Candidatus Jettenia caeni]
MQPDKSHQEKENNHAGQTKSNCGTVLKARGINPPWSPFRKGGDGVVSFILGRKEGY